MKIYTYYENIDFSNQEVLLRLWYFSWAKLGFEPIVLGIKDAEKHSNFSSFNNEMSNICQNIKSPNKRHEEDEKYVMSCHRRWLAYASQKPGRFLVSDYDVINFGLKPDDPKLEKMKDNKLYFLDNLCPCLAVGRPKHFQNFANDLLTNGKENVKNEREWNGSLYHDQEILLHNESFFRNSNKYEFYQHECHKYIWTQLRHYSHGYISELRSMPLEKLRTELIKTQLRIGN